MPQTTSSATGHREAHWPSLGQCHRGKVLVMDDDDTLRRLLDISLTSLGYEVDCVRDGAAAIEAYESARASGQPFGAVIFDLQIEGGMGGQETLAYLRQDDPEIKAILCSAADQDAVMQHYDAHGFAAKLEKPFRRADLHALLQRLVCNPSQTVRSAH